MCHVADARDAEAAPSESAADVAERRGVFIEDLFTWTGLSGHNKSGPHPPAEVDPLHQGFEGIETQRGQVRLVGQREDGLSF